MISKIWYNGESVSYENVSYEKCEFMTWLINSFWNTSLDLITKRIYLFFFFSVINWFRIPKIPMLRRQVEIKKVLKKYPRNFINETTCCIYVSIHIVFLSNLPI